ncbi:hypothetical protein BTO20_14860 [Mycobacterium dioxanotrophicus]|uniref:DUF2971 domain-containing protein n=1 Tax=Mycobacterium dioxanotrophicus TaxID=482462 RepID=A0A1Y0C3D2_9MYCO|nr:DUF2971 domain-containing protein [Mycobacterium dioxanotrophicus]ART69699.1 hypothetical protein BTO20_14860 [Mycobacterium dioxanotrophicus]
MMSAAEGDEPPSTLYHYTDAYGLLGIVQPSPGSWFIKVERPDLYYQRTVQLLASDVRFMNDTEELKFGARLLRERLIAAAADVATPPEFQRVFRDIEGKFDVDHILEWPSTCYACCFCAEGDLLSQWRGYAGGTGGFALGLSRDALENRTKVFDRPSVAELPMPVAPTLKRVVYGEEDGRAAADEAIREIMASEDKSLMTGRDNNHVRRLGLMLLYSRLLPALATIKAEGFKEEREWRLFLSGERQFRVDVRARRRGLVPYKQIAVNLSEQLKGLLHDQVTVAVTRPDWPVWS